MHQQNCQVSSVTQVGSNIFVLSFVSPRISTEIRPGQFVNIRVREGREPLLRRPFSVYRTESDRVEIIFNVVGVGTSLLRGKSPGDTVDVLGPLGRPFALDRDDYATAILVGGGLGVAPFPLTTASLQTLGKRTVTVLGARTADQLVVRHLLDVRCATDDGSRGYHGTAVDLAARTLADGSLDRPKLFGCGPTAMLRALAQLAVTTGTPCEVSLEGPMGCGFGICQGCPVELVGPEKRFALMCKDGPVFDVRTIRI